MLVASCPHLEAWWAGGSEGNGFESQEVAWEFQGNGGVGLAVRPWKGLPSQALQEAPGLPVLSGPGLGGARHTAFQLTGPSHLCSHPFRREHERDLSDPVCPRVPLSLALP